MQFSRVSEPVITGVAEAGIAYQTNAAAIDLAAEATALALLDAGLSLGDVDGLAVSKGADLLPADRPVVELAEHLGMTLSWSDTGLAGGASALIQVSHAAAAIKAGRCRIAVVVYASTQASDRHRRLGGYRRPASVRSAQHETAAGLLQPIGAAALAAARHMHEWGTTAEQLAAVVVSDRTWAQENPIALRREPITLEEVGESPYIATPLRKADCCPITDGAAAVVIEAAGREGTRSVPVAGWAEAHRHYSLLGASDLTTTAATETGPRALVMAGIERGDVGLIQLYDAFSILPLIFLEDLGFCEKGSGGSFVAEGVTLPGGSLPMNTQGGGLSHCHPGQYGLFLVVEAARQLRGEAPGHQVDAEWALCHASGGGAIGGSQGTLVLGRSQ